MTHWGALLLVLTDVGRAAPPAEAGVKVLMKVLSYDRALPGRQAPGRQELVIGVAWDPADAVGTAQGAEVMSALRRMRGWTVGGLQLADPRAMPRGRTELSTALPAVAAVVACGAIPAELIAAADAMDRPILTLDGSWAGRGAAVGLGQRQARLLILLDRQRARDQGMDPSGELFEVAELVGR